ESPAGTRVKNCQAVHNPSENDDPSGVAFHYGFFDFTIHDVELGGGTTLTLYLPDGAEPVTYYKYGPTPDNPSDHWYEFLYDGQTGADIGGDVITLYFVDGERGDDDLEANGTVIDLGGPGFPAKSGGSSGGSTGGSTGGSSTGGGCFIATAAFGSPMESHVRILRGFRDTCLLPCKLGRVIVKTYYRYSPPLADFIVKHGTLKAAVRIGLLPLVAISYSTLHFGLVITF
ncbi:unnamed protein product, partial [marine sediment metagenome]